ncbi:MAG: hypothetical protein OXC07_04465 [Kistimonas sp.]|nr:hypothetical protein [Kistimonas sp.]
MYAAIQNAVNTIIFSPIQRVRDGVRNYSAPLGRTVAYVADSAASLLDTEKNRAIMRGSYVEVKGRTVVRVHRETFVRDGQEGSRLAGGTMSFDLDGGSRTCSLSKSLIPVALASPTGIWLTGQDGELLAKRTPLTVALDDLYAKVLGFILPAETARDKAAMDASVPGSEAEDTPST